MMGKEYVLGRGRLYFDQFLPGTKTGTGELYFGNTPELSQSIDTETLDHYDADEGLNVKDESITLENNLTLTFTTDNISVDNVALWFAGEKKAITDAGANNVEETLTVRRGRFYQLGVSAENPTGVRNITNVSITDGEETPNPIDLEGNFEIDLEKGRIYVELDAPDVADDTKIIVKYDIEASKRTLVIGKGQEIRGALRFISANPVGKQRDYFFPYVKLTANGDYALKGSEWQQMSFSVEVLKKDAATERVYIDAE